jgi:septation ring formation regulator EzrA
MSVERFEAIENRLDRIEAFIEQLAVYQARAFEGLSGLTALIESEHENNQEFRRSTEEFRRSTQAAIERMDHIMDYLIRRDGEVN